MGNTPSFACVLRACMSTPALLLHVLCALNGRSEWTRGKFRGIELHASIIIARRITQLTSAPSTLRRYLIQQARVGDAAADSIGRVRLGGRANREGALVCVFGTVHNPGRGADSVGRRIRRGLRHLSPG